ncbi:MAG: formylglycine-generating enzyme family protein [Phycisphaerae bacterium]
MNRLTKRCVLALWTVPLLFLAAGLQADEVDDLINTCKPSPLDQAVWAESLLKAADGPKMETRPQAQVRVYEAAYGCGLKTAKGYPAAIRAARALRALLRAEPKQALMWEDRLLGALQRDWRAARDETKAQKAKAYVAELIAAGDRASPSGDLARAIDRYDDAAGRAKYLAPGLLKDALLKLRDAQERQRVQQEITRLEGLLAANPKNTAVREQLIRLYVVELDSPAQAGKLLTPDVGEKLGTYARLVAKRIEESAKEVCLELGDWYVSLADDKEMAGWRVTLRGKASALTRAKAYYERLAKLEKDPVQRAIVEAKLTKVQKDLADVAAELARIGAGGLAARITLDLGKDVKMELVLIPAGDFTMGSPAAKRGQKNEGPQHVVTISKPFYMSVTEVTQEQYARVTGKDPSESKGAKKPVQMVSWHDAVEFCKRLSARRRGARLPTEAQWEYACRAGSKTGYNFGDAERNLGGHAWYVGNGDKKPHEVAKKKPNAWGLYDMHGNVWEWCADWHGPYDPKAKPVVDPTGPTTGWGHAVRGGSASCFPGFCRSAYRSVNPPGDRFGNLGFRVVVSAGAK